MPLHIPLIHIFLSSLGDVAEERRLAQQVIQELPKRPASTGYCSSCLSNIVADLSENRRRPSPIP